MVQSMVSLEYVRIGSLGPFKASGRMMTILLF